MVETVQSCAASMPYVLLCLSGEGATSVEGDQGRDVGSYVCRGEFEHGRLKVGVRETRHCGISGACGPGCGGTVAE